jgi:glutamyl-tRNA reductase
MSGGQLQLRALIAHARDVPAIERTRLALELRAALRGRGLVIETCHRVEGYAATHHVEALDRMELPVGAVQVDDRAAVRHAVAVATGRDSVVVGEDQVLHQLREVVDATRGSGDLDPVLERLFSTALHAGRRARSWRQGPKASVATVALAEIERRAGPVRGRPLLVVGAGRMGRLAARSAHAAGAAVAVANRSSGPATDLAVHVGGRAVAFDPGSEIGSFAAILVALAGPWPIADVTRDLLATSAAIVVDLSVPVALDAGLVHRLGERILTGDDIVRLDRGGATVDLSQVRRLDALIERTTDDFMGWLEGREGRAAAAALASKADTVRAVELDNLWRQLPDLEPEERALIDAMARHLAARLLQEPLERLGNDPDGRTERAVREVFAL